MKPMGLEGKEFEDEIEGGDSEILINADLFDPREIDISTENQNVQYLIDLIEDRHVDLDTDFQRSPDLWSSTKMSRLIESLMIRLPIPPFYLAAEGQLPPTDRRPFQVVDGLQRLSALRRFAVDKKLRLTGLTFLKDHEGKGYDDLDKAAKRTLQRSQVTVYVIRPGTPKGVMYVLFERLNTGGLSLNHQEIRNALNQGTPSRYLKSLVTLPAFERLVPKNDGRMRNAELVLRYLAFRMTPPEKYMRPLNRFLDKAMEKLVEVSPEQLASWKEDFERALRYVPLLLGDSPFRRRQFNRALFEAWLYNLSLLEESRLIELQVKADILSGLYQAELSQESSLLSRAVISRTSDETAVINRMSEVKRLIDEGLRSI